MARTLAALAHRTPQPDVEQVDSREQIAEKARAGQVAFEEVIERPVAYKPAPRRLMVVDQRRDRKVESLRYAAVAAPLLFVFAATLLFGRTDVLRSGWFAVAALAAFAVAIVVRRNMKPHDDAVPLAWVDAARGELRVREYPGQDGLSESAPIDFGEVEHILFATRRISPAHTHGRGYIEASGVFVRLWDGTVWPIIPATLDRERAFSIAGRVASLIGVGVKQVGAGWSD